jgi:hypothetical protein
LYHSNLASFAARTVKSGSRVAGQEMANDVLSLVAQQRHHLFVGRLAAYETVMAHPLCEALLDNTKSPPLRLASQAMKSRLKQTVSSGGALVSS